MQEHLWRIGGSLLSIQNVSEFRRRSPVFSSRLHRSPEQSGMFHMEHSALQCAIQCGLWLQTAEQRFLLNCSTWNIRFYRASPSCSSAGFLGAPSRQSIRIVPHGTTAQSAPGTESLRRRRTPRHLTEGSVKTKRFQQKEQEKRRFALTILTCFAII